MVAKGLPQEPVFLPARLPNILLNGGSGIAVGMATDIPPHNLEEVINGINAYIENPEISIEELVKNHISGPDFPTAGFIYNQNDIIEAYTTGRGGVVTRAKADILEDKKGRFQIVISEITYQTNKSTLIQKIANLVKDAKIDGIRDIRDESDKEAEADITKLDKIAERLEFKSVAEKIKELEIPKDKKESWHTQTIRFCSRNIYGY